MLRVRGLRCDVSGAEVLRGVDLDIEAGEIAALIGANGAGKTTLLDTLCGRPRAHTGEIQFHGEDIAHRPPLERIKRGIAMVPENRRIAPDLTVSANLKLGAIALTGSPAAVRDEVLALFPSLRARLKHKAGALSVLEQQMLAFARALMSRPRLLLVDEASRGLAAADVRRIFDLLATLRRDKGMTILIAEQNAFQALKLADRAFLMAGGEIVRQGSGMELLADSRVQPALFGGGDSALSQAVVS